jgi:GT2 family glycosyltransferase
MKTYIAQYDLGRPIRTIWGLEGCSQGIVLVRNHGFPIDILWLPHDPRRSGLSRQEIEREIFARLPFFPLVPPEDLMRGPGLQDPVPPISVIVCTRDRAWALQQCLIALERLEDAPYEVIVVDNASRSGETREMVAQTPFRYVREDRPGLNWARNRGVEEARCDVIACIDDDVHVDPGWLRGVARAFQRPEVDAVTGLVLPAEMETLPQLLFEIYGGMGKGTKRRKFQRARMSSFELIRAQDLGVGANMAFRRRVFEKFGGFDTALDVGTPAAGGGDLDMFQRVLVNGGTLCYEPSALVWHQHRRDMKGLRTQLYHNGRSYGVYLIKSWRSGDISRFRIGLYIVFRWMPWLVGRLGLGLVRRHRLPVRLLWAELWGALHAPLAYLATIRHDRRVREKYRLERAPDGFREKIT